jgi:hypothetical protein
MLSIDFGKIAPHLANPLVLVGFCIFLFYAALQALVKGKLFAPLSGSQSASIYRLVFGKLYWLALLVVVAGFGYAYFLSARGRKLRYSGPYSFHVFGQNRIRMGSTRRAAQPSDLRGWLFARGHKQPPER